MILLPSCESLIYVIETKNDFGELTIFKDQFPSRYLKNDNQKPEKESCSRIRLRREEFGASTSENIVVENLVAGPSNSLKIQTEKLDESKPNLRREIVSDLTKILADNQKEMLRSEHSWLKNP